MKYVVISPYAQQMRNGKENPKNFPYWEEVVNKLLFDHNINVIQIGSSKDNPIIKPFKSDLHSYDRGQHADFTFIQNATFSQIKELIEKCDTWISIDSFLQHLCAYHKLKRGIVIFSQSDPKIFGYTRNLNLLKDRKYLRDKQFWLWEQCEYNKDAFVTAEEVIKAVLKLLELK